MLQKTLILAAVGIIGLAGAAEARDQIRIVGSSTVSHFQQLLRNSSVKPRTSKPLW